MAKESFDKEIQLLRLLLLTGDAFTRPQLAQRLGISVHTFDKTWRRLKEIAAAMQSGESDADTEALAQLWPDFGQDATDPLLQLLFRAKSLKQSESLRLSRLLAAMQGQARTTLELLDEVCVSLEEEARLPDEKTIRNDLKYLEQVGAIRRESTVRPYRYRLHDDLIQKLSTSELLELYGFIEIMAYTRLPAVWGYLLRDNLKRHLLRMLEPHMLEGIVYRYHYDSRLLDEAHLYTLLEALEHRRYISFVYFSPKGTTSYSARQTNPRYADTSEHTRKMTLPLYIVYDHQYGRWYVLGSERGAIRKYRLEGMTQIEQDKTVDEAVFIKHRQQLREKLAHSWLIDTGSPVPVRVRFFKPRPPYADFVRERVMLQGQWGVIVEESADSFVFEIVVNGTIEIKPWLRSFGSSCEVLEPAALRKEIIEEWKEIAAGYESL